MAGQHRTVIRCSPPLATPAGAAAAPGRTAARAISLSGNLRVWRGRQHPPSPGAPADPSSVIRRPGPSEKADVMVRKWSGNSYLPETRRAGAPVAIFGNCPPPHAPP
ncbi:hypothetical protein GCM10009736_57030 [Actinomadura bangladeshensis]